MKKAKKLIALLLALVMVLSLAACGGGGQKKEESSADSENAATEEKTGSYRIALSVPAVNSNFYRGLVMGAEQKADELGVDLTVVISDYDSAKQQQQIENLLLQDLDAIMVSPGDADAIGEAMRRIGEAELPNVIVDRMPTDTTYVDAFVAAEDFSVGEQIGHALAEGFEKYGTDETIKCIEIIGSLKDNSSMLRHDGFENVLEEHNIEVVGTVNSEWDTELCYSRLNDAIEACGGDFNAIVMPSDFLIDSVMSCLDARGMKHQLGEEGAVIVISADGGPRGIEMVRDGYSYAAINTDALVYCGLAMEYLVKLLDGDTEQDSNLVVPAQVVTSENCDDEGLWGNAITLDND